MQTHLSSATSASSPPIDETHDPDRDSWVETANGHADFPIQNLPLGRFSSIDSPAPRPGIAIGDAIIDLQALLALGVLQGDAESAARAAVHGPGNALLGLSPSHRQALRRSLSELFCTKGKVPDGVRKGLTSVLRQATDCVLHLPATIGNYSDFNAGIHHAANGGRRRGLPEPLLPNYRHMPIAYHGRASSVRPSGHPVRRPAGQYLVGDAKNPVFQPTQKLDFEFEIGVWLAQGNELGEPVPISEAANRIAGYCIVNDWSARDIQAWESPRLGPFLGKSFCTTASPWVVTPEALAPFRGPGWQRTQDDPEPLPHLFDPTDASEGMPQLHLEVWHAAAQATEMAVISRTHTRNLFWTPAQMIAHHTSNGCNLQVGDLFGTGTVSGTEPDSFGTLLDAVGRHPAFLQDGDQLVLKARAIREGFVTIGFGDCAGRIEAARHG